MSIPTEGNLEYSARAFIQDAQQALRGDVVRGLIELITNCDDAYGKTVGGTISIEVKKNAKESKYKFEIKVRDAAKGMDAETMLKRLTVLGSNNENFMQDAAVRGLLGRGAKDVASFGAVVFGSIKDGKYSQLTLTSEGKFSFEAKDLEADTHHYESLKLQPSQNGVTVTMMALKNIVLPDTNKLQNKLQTNVQLRELLQRRSVTFIAPGMQGEAVLVPPNPSKSELFNSEVSIPVFDAQAHLRVFKLDVPATGSVNDFSMHGIMIKSGVTIYQNSLFGLENHSQANFICGVLECPKINELIREFDAAEISEQNETRLVTRDRDGLQKSHSFTKELNKAVYAHLSPIMDSLEKEHGVQSAKGEKLQNAFRDTAATLRNDVNLLLKELDEETNGPDPAAEFAQDFYLIPPQIKLAPGAMQSVTVRVRKGLESGLHVRTPAEDEGTLLSTFVPEVTEWREHERLDYVQSNFQVSAADFEGSSLVIVNVGQLEAFLKVSVAEPIEQEFAIPVELEFSSDRASIAKYKTRKLELVAPLDFADREVSIRVEGLPVGSYPEKVILRPSPEGAWCRAAVPVTAGSTEGVAVIHATLNNGEEASAQLTVSADGPTGGVELEFNLMSGTEVDRRVSLSTVPGKIVINVQGQHPSFSGVFGKWNNAESKFTEEDSVAARSVLGEVISRALAQYFVSQQTLKHPEDFTDAERIFNRVEEITAKFAQKSHAALRA